MDKYAIRSKKWNPCSDAGTYEAWAVDGRSLGSRFALLPEMAIGQIRMFYRTVIKRRQTNGLKIRAHKQTG